MGEEFLKLPEKEQQLGWSVAYITDSTEKGISTDLANRAIVINTARFSSPQAAQLAGAIEGARGYALENMVREVPVQTLTELLKKDSPLVSDLCLFEGMGFLARNQPKKVERITQDFPAADNYATEFRNACVWYIMKGSFPPTSKEVHEALMSLPIGNTGNHLLTTLGSGTKNFDLRETYYKKYIAPAFVKMGEYDRDLQDVAGDAFIPSTDDPEQGELFESEIDMRVEPFLGGYYPERIYSRVDWATMRMVDPGTPSQRWQEIDDASQKKQYKFIGVFSPDQLLAPHRIPLRRTSLPISSTLARGYALHRDANGCFLLERISLPEEQGSGETQQDKVILSFDFSNKKNDHAWITREPTPEEYDIPDTIIETFSQQTKEFLESLKEARITDHARVMRILKYVQDMLHYVQSSAVGDVYKAAGRDYFRKLEELKKADCDVSNFYALALIRSVGIACDMPTGYYAKRDKRFSFTALAGSKHAWLTYYNKEKGGWSDPIDATPPDRTPPPPEEEEKGDSGGVGFGFFEDTQEDEKPPEESDEEQAASLTWSDEELARLMEVIQKHGNKSPATPSTITPEEVAKEFLVKEGVELEQWSEVKAYIEQINSMPIPRDHTVEKFEDSTIGEEWEKIFELLLIAYRIPKTSMPRLGRESEGGILVDSTAAVIDLLSGQEDKFGYSKKTNRIETEYLPINFSDDVLLDLTASMDSEDEYGTNLKDAQRRFILSNLFHGLRLNDNLRQYEALLKPVPYVTSHILSIHGGSFGEQTRSGERITIKRIVELYKTLDVVTPGAGNMLDALKRYRDSLVNDHGLLQSIKSGEVLKTLTIISDGNLWCSSCGEESCRVKLHEDTIRQTNTLVQELRAYGVFVNAIGFTNKSLPVIEIFKNPNDPRSAQIASDVTQAVVLHHGQVGDSLKKVRDIAHKRITFPCG